MSTTYSECLFVALGIPHAMRMPHIMLSSVALPALQHFSTLSHKRHDFRGKKKPLLSIKCVLSFSAQLLSELFFSLRRNEPDMIINVSWSSCKVPVILVRY
jgi:hypothetical protein